eukprot:CAMPEP_0118937976 /NCGR_PEP_ID=MMETSP1169-20130426/24439_1 /TAXON_ID=36882 /ORGANISM="Pyramimonas obovata, Strain CCMP722" /LENGTH=108 /DNA_ID=CAMNT_0006881781 /DNA_START=704 /DNA_END=1030 /DNA_ORIENTATION=+
MKPLYEVKPSASANVLARIEDMVSTSSSWSGRMSNSAPSEVNVLTSNSPSRLGFMAKASARSASTVERHRTHRFTLRARSSNTLPAGSRTHAFRCDRNLPHFDWDVFV